MKKYQYLINSILVITIASCQSKIVSVKKRGFENRDGTVHLRTQAKRDNGPDIFLKKSQVKITKVHKNKKDSGSLFDFDNSLNYLIGDGPSKRVGSYITIAIADSSEVIGDDLLDIPKSPRPSNEEKISMNGTGDSEINSGKENLKESQKQSEGDKKTIGPKKIKMKIVSRANNGDFILESRRSSINENEANSIHIQAVLPQKFIVNKNTFSTDDLVNINWIEISEGELSERKSVGWVSEYSRRLSGFSEARSKMDLALADEKKRYEDLQKKLYKKLNGIGQERVKLTKERDKIRNEKKILNDKLGGLEQELEKQRETIDDQRKKIDELSDKPSDQIGDADGA